jgi:hypothetical protein
VRVGWSSVRAAGYSTTGLFMQCVGTGGRATSYTAPNLFFDLIRVIISGRKAHTLGM